MYKNVVFYENECVPVYVTSSSYKMMASLLQLCTYILISCFFGFFLLSTTSLHQIRINKCKPFHVFYFKPYLGKLRIRKAVTLKLPVYYKTQKSIVVIMASI